MQEHQLSESIQLVVRLVDAGEFEDALTVMAPWADAGLPDLQKTVVANNVAHIYAAMQRPVEAMAWYDWGLPVERALRGSRLAEGKAAMLVALGRGDEAAALLQSLLDGGGLAADDRARVEAALRAPRGS